MATTAPNINNSNTQHNPPSVYQPNPYPLNPTEGNPWSVAPSEQPYTSTYQHPTKPQDSSTSSSSSYNYQHGYNPSSSDDSSYRSAPTSMPIPTPTSYFPTSNPLTAPVPPPVTPPPVHHHHHHHQQTGEDGDGSSSDGDSETGVTYDLGDSYGVNPGITGHDPSKLNTNLDDYNPRKRPSIYRFIARVIQLVANIGTFIFILCAPIYSKQGKPDFIPQNLVIGIFIVSIVSILVSFGFVAFYVVRRFRTKTKKFSRWILFLVDGILGASYGLLMVFSIKDTRCGIGQENGWCDFYNTAIFFIVLSFVMFALAFIWDFTGSFVLISDTRKTKKRNKLIAKSKNDKDSNDNNNN